MSSAEETGRGSALRLVARLDDRTLRLQVTETTQVLGSAEGCDLRLDHPTVSRRHAQVHREGRQVLLRDLGSLNGLRVRRRRVQEARLGPGDRLVIGSVPVEVEVEEVPEGDLEVAISCGTRRAVAEPAPAVAARVAQLAGTALHASLPTTRVQVTRTAADDRPTGPEEAPAGVLFTVRRELTGTVETEQHRVTARQGHLVVEVDLPAVEQAGLARPRPSAWASPGSFSRPRAGPGAPLLLPRRPAGGHVPGRQVRHLDLAAHPGRRGRPATAGSGSSWVWPVGCRFTAKAERLSPSAPRALMCYGSASATSSSALPLSSAAGPTRARPTPAAAARQAFL